MATLVLLLAPALARAAGGPTHPLRFVLQGEVQPGNVQIPPPEANIEDACGVAVDSVGDIYVSDYYHRMIDVYGPFREYLTQIADPGPDGPCNLAVDGEGNVYVNNWRRDVIRFAPSSYPPSEATRYGAPTVLDFPAGAGERATGLAYDTASGALYVDERTQVAVFEAAQLASQEPAPTRVIGVGEIGAGYGVAVSEFAATAGEVYVPDAAAGTVLVFAPDGSELAPIDGAGTPQRGFSSLLDSDIAVDQRDGHVFVADDLEPGFAAPAAAVDEFNAAGEFRGQLPGAIADAEPSALAVDSTGNVYATSGNSEGASLLGFGPTEPGARLEVTLSGAGSGSVGSEPAGIACPGACAAEFNSGEEVVLTAAATAGSTFAGWSGCGRPNGNRCGVLVSGAQSVTADFAPEPASPLAAPAVLAGAPPAAGPASPSPIPGLLALRQLTVGVEAPAFELTVPEPGLLQLRGTGVEALSRRSSGGSLRVRLRLEQSARRALARSPGRRLRRRIEVTFVSASDGQQKRAGAMAIFESRKGRGG